VTTDWGARNVLFAPLHETAMTLAARPRSAIYALIAAQLLFWGILPALASSSPPLDVVEGLVWGREWLLGTHKHPTLPAWLIEISLFITGGPILGPHLLSQASVGLTYLFIFETGRRLTSERHAAVATFVAASTVYFTWGAHEFNHNVVQLPIWSGAILLFTIVRHNPSKAGSWLALGAVAGLGIHAKYSVLILYLILAICLLSERGMRNSLRTPWPWLALATALLVSSPHLLWLASNDFITLHYMSSRSAAGTPFISAAEWVVAQIANHIPTLIFFAIVGYRAILSLPRCAEPNRHVRYVAALVLGPALLAAVGATIAGAGLRDMWGSPMFTLSGLLIVMLLQRQWSHYLTARALVVAIGFIVVTAAAFSATVMLSPMRDRPVRSAWPMAEIAAKANASWSARTDEKLKIVAGEMWLAGLVSAGSADRPSVMYGGSLRLSPWLSERQLREQGALYIWEGEHPPQGLIPSSVDPEEFGTFTVSRGPLNGGVIGYAVRLPVEN
jgi:4-amino-4-deoxy-L-arabinose transferase-like glycosyltransferase